MVAFRTALVFTLAVMVQCKTESKTRSLMRRSLEGGNEVVDATGAVEDVDHVTTHAKSYRRRRSVATKTQGIDFGGHDHGTWVGNDYRDNSAKTKMAVLDRPEYTKSKRCNSTGCTECEHPLESGCWHGSSLDAEKAQSPDHRRRRTGSAPATSFQAIHVAADDSHTSFASEMWARCHSDEDDSMWVFVPLVMLNCNLELYANDSKFHQFNVSTWEYRPFSKITKELTVEKDQSVRVRLVLVPVDPTQEATAQIQVMALDAEPSMDECMAVKDCLSKLGDGSDEGFELRNRNEMQALCLEAEEVSERGTLAETEVQSWPAALQTKCTEWRDCVPTAQKEVLMTSLRAVGIGAAGATSAGDDATDSTGGGLIQITSRALKARAGTGAAEHSEDVDGCVDPSVSDPESWDCDCLATLNTTCGGPNATCFQEQMCKKAQHVLCESWINRTCRPDWLDSSQSGALVETSAESSSSLDESLAGKCV